MKSLGWGPLSAGAFFIRHDDTRGLEFPFLPRARCVGRQPNAVSPRTDIVQEVAFGGAGENSELAGADTTVAACRHRIDRLKEGPEVAGRRLA